MTKSKSPDREPHSMPNKSDHLFVIWAGGFLRPSPFVLRHRLHSAVWACLLVPTVLASPVWSESPLSLIRFRSIRSDQPHEVSETNGPWMIFAASFAGEHAERDARELVDELRKEYRLNAYLHKKRFDFSDPVEGLGLDEYGNRKSMRFNADSAFDEIAVLVGDYTSLDDPALQKHLQKVKYARPGCLTLRKDGRPTTQRFAALRALQQRLNRDEEKRRKGPMGSAFATRNPRLPREYFEPDGLDDLLVSMNQGRKYSLLDCPGIYTVRVASFRGNVVIDQREVQAIESGRRMKSKLDDAAVKAQRMVELLRGRGDEAYVFHDRHESIVTVGSFQSVGNKLSDGRIDLNPAIHGIMERFGPQRQPLRGQDGTALAGIQPRSLKGLPFDVQPLPVLVPRRSVAADYATTR